MMALVHCGDNWEDFEETVKDFRFFDLARQRHFYNL